MNNVQLFVNDGGQGGTPLVFLHSLTGDSRHWHAQLAHMRQSRRAIALDLRGHGNSPAPNGNEYSLDAMVHDVQHAIDQLGLSSIILVGHSMGGAVAARFAGLFPELLAGLILVDAAGDATQIPEAQVQGLMGALASPAYQDVVAGYWEEILENSAEHTRTTVLSTLDSIPQAAMLTIFERLMRFNPLPNLARYAGKLLIVSTPLTDSPFALHRLLPDAPHAIVAGTSHWLHLDKSAELNRILDQCLADWPTS